MRNDPTKDLLDSISRNAGRAFAPTDHALLRQAQSSKGHISDKAVMDEYNRLIDEKLRPRSFWSRLFGG